MISTEPSPAFGGEPAGRLVLVAEDNELNRKVVVIQLRLIGLPSEVAVNGEEALRRWRCGGVALLLTDLQMPGMDGFELARKMRAEESSPARLPIVALTANALASQEADCRDAGMDAYLTKPVSLALLRSTLERFIGSAGVPE